MLTCRDGRFMPGGGRWSGVASARSDWQISAGHSTDRDLARGGGASRPPLSDERGGARVRVPPSGGSAAAVAAQQPRLRAVALQRAVCRSQGARVRCVSGLVRRAGVAARGS